MVVSLQAVTVVFEIFVGVKTVNFVVEGSVVEARMILAPVKALER